MDQPWQIELFGWLRATQGDRVVARFRTHRASSLLAYLAYYVDRSHPRDALIELLWPGSDRHLGRTSLRTELTSLRHQLEPPGVPAGAVLMADRATLRLNPDACVTDVGRFETALTAAQQAADPVKRVRHLITAAQLYRGELLPGSFEDWVLPERQRLAELFLAALHEVVGLLQKLGDLTGALQWARRAVAADPLGEESHQRLVRLLLASGQVEAAREQYEQSEKLLLREMGTGLSPEIRTLVRELSPVKDRPPVTPLEARGRKRQRRPHGRGPESPPAGAIADQVVQAGAAVPHQQPEAPTRPSGNLPLRFTRFFGRQRELEQLQLMLRESETQLVTMTGPGGTGKTRLAQQVAEKLWDSFSGGIWFVGLRDLTESALIPAQILVSLRLTPNPQVEPLEQVVAFLSRAPALLLLDNYEHLVGGGAESVRRLLEEVKLLTVLVTSRQCLGLEGEREFPVLPLPVPELLARAPARDPARGKAEQARGHAQEQDLPATLLRCPSVVLFVDRAQAMRPDFQVTPHNAGVVATLCQRLEGLPLAIELAAARSGVLTPQQMLSRLEQRFELLVGRQRPADPRHRSLRATLDWSYQLLSLELQRFFARLSVFRGGFTLEAAEVVCQEPLALDYLEQLRECSLVLAEEQSGSRNRQPRASKGSIITAYHSPRSTESEMRLRLLETLREYGSEQLTKEERSALVHGHAAYYLALAKSAHAEIGKGPLEAAIEQLEAEHDNLRAALAWCRSESGDREWGLRLCCWLGPLWQVRYWAEGREWLEGLLCLPGAEAHTLERAQALNGLAVLLGVQGDYAAARPRHEEALWIYQELDYAAGAAASLYFLANNSLAENNMGAAEQYHSQSLQIARELDDDGIVAPVLCGLAEVAWCRSDYERAASLATESLALSRRVGHSNIIGASLCILSKAALGQGDLTSALKYGRASIVMGQELGDNRGIAIRLESLAAVIEAEGKPEHAVRVLAAAHVLRMAIGAPQTPRERLLQEQRITTLRSTLGDEEYSSCWREGQAMSVEQAIAEALQEAPAH